MASRFILPFADVGSGIKPSSGAKLFFYETGTNTFRNTFTDQAATTPNANPVIADANGLFPSIFINGTYKVILQDKNSSQIWEADPTVSLISIDNEINVLDNTSLIAASGLSIGDKLLCDRYYSGGELVADLIYNIVASGTGTDDGGSFRNLDNGNQAQLVSPQTATVLAWGARNATESSDQIQAAINFVKVRGYGSVDFTNSAFFLVNKPLIGTHTCHYKGKAIIRAQAPFSTIQVDNFTGGTASFSTILFFCDNAPLTAGSIATINDPTGSRRLDVQIDESLVLDCDDVADYGIFTDNYQYYDIACKVTDATKWGIRINFYGWSGEVSSVITGPAEGGLWIGTGANGLNLDGLLVWGNTKTPTIAGILIDGDNNGIMLSGSTIEKVNDGILLREGFGPIDISGVDFEQISRHVVNAEGADVPGRINGPITISGSFLETSSATEAIIKAVNTNVIVRGNRARNAAKLVEQSSSGVVVLEDNVLEASVLSIGTGRIITRNMEGRTNLEKTNSIVSTSEEKVKEIINYAYPYADLPTSGLDFSHQVVSGTNRTMFGNSSWYVDNFNLDVSIGRMGVELNYVSNDKNIEPATDSDHNLGTTAKAFKTVNSNVYIQSAGVGVGYNPVNNGDIVMQFTSNTVVAIKAKGSDGVIRTGNITLS
jgi:hypothetical protein